VIEKRGVPARREIAGPESAELVEWPDRISRMRVRQL
jgi:hypothetical protein